MRGSCSGMYQIDSYALLSKIVEIDGVRSVAIVQAGDVKAVLVRDGGRDRTLQYASVAASSMVSELGPLGCRAHAFTFCGRGGITCVQSLERHVVLVRADRGVRLAQLELSFQMLAQILETSQVEYSARTAP